MWGNTQNQLQKQLLHFAKKVIEASFHEAKKLLCAFTNLDRADLAAGDAIQLLQDDLLHSLHHLKQVVLKRNVDPEHARLRGEAEELGLVGHRINRHRGVSGDVISDC